LTILLDVNVVLALIDPAHVFHDAAHAWFPAAAADDWATCPIVENGVIRIAGSPSYPNFLGGPAIVADRLAEFCRADAHTTWADDISLLSCSLVDHARIGSAKHVTDIYLLALATQHVGRLATFDRRLPTTAVTGGAEVLLVIPPYASSSTSQ
jgi:uncharacterized protein